MECESTNPTIWKLRIVQNSTAIRMIPKRESVTPEIMHPATAQFAEEGFRTTLNEIGTDREPPGNEPVSDLRGKSQLGKLGGLGPVKSDCISAGPVKTGRSHLICPTRGPILLATHPLHPSWKRSSTLSMTCIIGGSFFMRSAQLLGMSGHTRPQPIEVQH